MWQEVGVILFPNLFVLTRRIFILFPEMSKRTRKQAGISSYKPISKRRTTAASAINIQLPQRAYANSMVPLRSGGYRQNTQEKKVYDIASATYQVNTTGNVTALCTPILGTDFTQRIGRKICLKSCYIRGIVRTEGSATAAASAAGPSQLVRLMLVMDLQPNATLATITQILNTADPTSQLNLDNRDRFKILKDKQWALDPYMYSTVATQSLASASGQSRPLKVYKKLNTEVLFNATNGGTFADIITGNLLMVWIGSTAAGTNTDGNAVVSTRVRFSDV